MLDDSGRGEDAVADCGRGETVAAALLADAGRGEVLLTHGGRDAREAAAEALGLVADCGLGEEEAICKLLLLLLADCGRGDMATTGAATMPAVAAPTAAVGERPAALAPAAAAGA